LELTRSLLAEVGGSQQDFPESLHSWTENRIVSDSSLRQEGVRVKKMTVESGFTSTWWACISAWSESRDTEAEDIQRMR